MPLEARDFLLIGGGMAGGEAVDMILDTIAGSVETVANYRPETGIITGLAIDGLAYWMDRQPGVSSELAMAVAIAGTQVVVSNLISLYQKYAGGGGAGARAAQPQPGVVRQYATATRVARPARRGRVGQVPVPVVPVPKVTTYV